MSNKRVVWSVVRVCWRLGSLRNYCFLYVQIKSKMLMASLVFLVLYRVVIYPALIELLPHDN